MLQPDDVEAELLLIGAELEWSPSLCDTACRDGLGMRLTSRSHNKVDEHVSEVAERGRGGRRRPVDKSGALRLRRCVTASTRCNYPPRGTTHHQRRQSHQPVGSRSADDGLEVLTLAGDADVADRLVAKDDNLGSRR